MRGWDHLRADHLTAQARTQRRAHGEGIAKRVGLPRANARPPLVKVRLGLPREYKAKVRQRGPVHLIQQLTFAMPYDVIETTRFSILFCACGAGSHAGAMGTRNCIGAGIIAMCIVYLHGLNLCKGSLLLIAACSQGLAREQGEIQQCFSRV